MERILKQAETLALTNEEIQDALNKKANLFTYPQLSHMQSLDQLLEPYGKCVLLYETKPSFGHWVALMARPEEPGAIEYFDSYGYGPDAPLEKIDPEFRVASNQDEPHLTRLFEHAMERGRLHKIYYNEMPLQKMSPDVSTCGRHVILRLGLSQIPLKQYQALLTKSKLMDPDLWVTCLTSFV